ncbi:hypothetical protein HAPG_00065 [Halorubrum phage GNf2]|nr:hypothetical protein HAPG_00065 [Halorubrum phage GNf2]
MAEPYGNTKCVEIELSEADVRRLRDGESQTVECPHTSNTIYLSIGKPTNETCDCCGQEIENGDYITPSISSSTLDRIENGGTIRYGTCHDDSDISIYVRGKWDFVGGWQ